MVEESEEFLKVISPQDQEKGRFPLKQVRPLGPSCCLPPCQAVLPATRCRAAAPAASVGAGRGRRGRQPLLAACVLFRIALPSVLQCPPVHARCSQQRNAHQSCFPTTPCPLQRDDAINAGFAWFREKGLIPAGGETDRSQAQGQAALLAAGRPGLGLGCGNLQGVPRTCFLQSARAGWIRYPHPPSCRPTRCRRLVR